MKVNQPPGWALAVLLALLLLGPAVAWGQDEPADAEEPLPPLPELPAFPGAEGFGAASVGGRGGRVIKVTNLNDTGPGSLRSALRTKGARIIVFEVSGVIPGPHELGSGQVYLAGQTAPGAGVTITGRLSQLQGKEAFSDVTIRFLRIRPSKAHGGVDTKDDAIQLPAISRMIFDRLSVAWGRDETVDIYKVHDATVQWCTIEESIWRPGEDHNCGLIFSEKGRRITVHHNLFAHHRSRNPCIKGGDADIRNNVVYNFRDGVTMYDHPLFSTRMNIVGNYFMRGPSDPDIFPFNFLSRGLYYTQDNFISEVGVIHDPWAEASKHYGLAYHAKRGKRVAEPFPFPPVATDSSQVAFERVVQEAGALPHDAVTRRTLQELHQGKGSWGKRNGDVLMDGLQTIPPPLDSDNDGMPDTWETRYGLNPQLADHNTIMTSGYTAIEQYVNELAEVMIAAQRQNMPTHLAQDLFWRPLDGSSPPPLARPTSVTATAPAPPVATGAKSAPPAAPAAKPAPPTAAPAAVPDSKPLPPLTVIIVPAGRGDADIALQLKGQTQVVSLHLHRTAITDAGLAAVKPLTSLRILSLQNTAITDAGLSHLLGLPALQALDVSGTHVTPHGLTQLKAIASLRILDVPADFTEQMLLHVRQQLPRVTVERGGR